MSSDNIIRVPESHLAIMQQFQGMVTTIRHNDQLLSTNPVVFEYDGDHVRFSTLKARLKYKNLLADSRITFCVVDDKDMTRYVEIRGRAELIDDPTGAFQLKLWQRMTGLDSFELDPEGAERVTVKIIAEQVSTPLLYGGQLSK